MASGMIPQDQLLRCELIRADFRTVEDGTLLYRFYRVRPAGESGWCYAMDIDSPGGTTPLYRMGKNRICAAAVYAYLVESAVLPVTLGDILCEVYDELSSFPGQKSVDFSLQISENVVKYEKKLQNPAPCAR